LQLEYKLSIGSYADLLGGFHPTGIENVFLERIMDTIR
jgi:26S proteasome regulatory subunit N12